jgi:hypothetical protein
VKRYWVVDDAIPVQELHAAGPLPLLFEAPIVRYLIEQVPANQWAETPVHDLCQALCGEGFETTFFLSPEQMLRALARGATPPHAVIFDWEYGAPNNERNVAALDRLLRGSFVYVQIYTHIGPAAVEPSVAALREQFPGRLLITKDKLAVNAAQLHEDLERAWGGTIAGEVADQVRSEAVAAVERTLIDVGGVHKSVLAEMAENAVENLLQLVLAKVRDEIGDAGFAALETVFKGKESAESPEAVRRLLSVWYYYFPHDDRVRIGDLIELPSGDLGFVVTPVCDLAQFPKKTGRRLTWVQTVQLDESGIATLNNAGIKFSRIGKSIIADHAGDTVILLPNVPTKNGSRESTADYAVLCHAWSNQLFDKPEGGALLYKDIAPYSRRCTVADPYASGIIGKIMSVISSPGTPDLPEVERSRLMAAAGVSVKKAPVAPVQAGAALATAPNPVIASGAGQPETTGTGTIPASGPPQTVTADTEPLPDGAPTPGDQRTGD